MPVLALVAALCGCAEAGSEVGEESASCADTVTFRGHEYTGSGARLLVPLGPPVGSGERRPCEGSGGGSVPLVRVRGVDPEHAVATDDPEHLYVSTNVLRARELPESLEPILLGPACEPAAPFTLAGTFVGSSDLDQPHSVTLDVDETDAVGRPYLGLAVSIRVPESTVGLSAREDFHPFAPVSAKTRRLRARVGCVAADRPNETFVAEEIRAAAPEPPMAQTQLCAPDATAPPCGSGAGLGVSYPYELLTHCGVQYALFDGRLWLLDPPLDDGSGNPPPGWDNPTQHGLMRLLADDVAEFRTPELNVRFEPAPPDYERPGCA